MHVHTPSCAHEWAPSFTQASAIDSALTDVESTVHTGTIDTVMNEFENGAAVRAAMKARAACPPLRVMRAYGSSTCTLLVALHCTALHIVCVGAAGECQGGATHANQREHVATVGEGACVVRRSHVRRAKSQPLRWQRRIAGAW